MSLTAQLAKNVREVHFGGNWTCSNFRDQLADVTWLEANRRIYSFNSIATLVFHVNYYVAAVSKVIKGGPLDSKDELSFENPPITSQDDWEDFRNKILDDAEKFAVLVEKLPENSLWENFTDVKYGNYYRNIQGIVDHAHYHLGQIVLIKKIIKASDSI